MSAPKSLKPKHTFQGHTARAWHITPHPTLPLLSSCSSDLTTRIWNTATGRCIAILRDQHKRSVRCSAFKPPRTNSGDERVVLATASFDGTIGIWEYVNDLEDNQDGEWDCIATLEGHENEVKSVVWSADSTFLATCSRDKSVWIWESEDDDEFECLSVLQEHSQDVKCVAFSPRESLLASASYDDTVILYRDSPSDDDWTPVAVLKGHGGTVWGVAFSPDGRTLASSSDDCTVRLWQKKKKEESKIIRTDEDWEEVAQLPQVHTRSIYSVAFSPSGRIATAGGDGIVAVYKRKEGDAEEWEVEYVQTEAHGVQEVNCVTWQVQGDREVVWTAGDDGKVRGWTMPLPTCDDISDRRSLSPHFIPTENTSKIGLLTSLAQRISRRRAPRIALSLGIDPAYHIPLVAARSLSILPSVLGFLDALSTAYTNQYLTTDPHGGTGNVWKEFGDRECKIWELGAACMWCAVCGYLSFWFTDGLMLRWLIRYSPLATCIRLLSLSTINAALTYGIVWAEWGWVRREPSGLLVAWIVEACVLTVAYTIQDWVTSDLSLPVAPRAQRSPRTVRFKKSDDDAPSGVEKDKEEEGGYRELDLVEVAVFAVVPVGMAGFVTMVLGLWEVHSIRAGWDVGG
ncbi:WD40 repeat-like protein [Saitoella complicata NRRL Y-17804]|uniref:WD40 repeat-like protein n=1 Tax=Saitoella complicata (strain BCRC 22490 / CBS 7301 / JCM 7358 / NBRC 10748 / NRRL Y-17804) TaxID=698492 RepID=UPI000866CB6F|nr:WD40 repeat-like protein [Saitoella complicata NRRL Y-17804]ODQ53049.1 WD40 repeat-like protein [Saitoella complicata NRRL Y-17804]